MENIRVRLQVKTNDDPVKWEDVGPSALGKYVPTIFKNTLVTEPFDSIELTYIAVGDGTGEIGTVVYKNDGTTVASLTLGYDGDNRLTSVTKS